MDTFAFFKGMAVGWGGGRSLSWPGVGLDIQEETAHAGWSQRWWWSRLGMEA